jgi:hypothetical protein
MEIIIESLIFGNDASLKTNQVKVTGVRGELLQQC